MKTNVRIVSLFMALILTVCSLPFSAVAESGALTVKPITDYTPKWVGCFGNTVTPLENCDISGYTMERLIEWDVDEKNMSNTSSCVLQFRDMAESLADFDGFMFYVSLPAANTVVFNLELKNPNDKSRWKYDYAPSLLPVVSAEYQYLAMGDTEWKTAKLVGTQENYNYKGGMRFDSAFEGFVKVPYASLKNDSGFKLDKSSDLLEMAVFWIKEFGGDYGEVIVGPIFTVTGNSDSGAPIISGVNTAAANTARYITDYIPKYLGIDGTMSTLPDNADIPLFVLNGSTMYNLENSTVGGTKEPQLWIDGMDESLCDTTGILLYIDTPADNLISFYFNLAIPEDSSRWKYGYAPEMSLYVGNSYFVLPDGATEWSEKNVVSSWKNEYKGGMYFESAFKGYVKVPYESFANDAHFKMNTEIDRLTDISVRFKKLGGDYGAVAVQPAMLLKNSTDGLHVDVDMAEKINVAQIYGGSAEVNRTTAAAGERVDVTVSAESGKVISAKGVTVTYTDFSGEHTAYAEKSDRENTYTFYMPLGENVTVGAEFLNSGSADFAMLSPKVEGKNTLHFTVRGMNVHSVGMLVAPYENLSGRALTRELCDIDVIDVPCANISRDFKATGADYSEYTLLYDSITEKNLTEFFTVRGYAVCDDGIVYSDSVTVSYDTLKNGYLPNMETFGNITATGSYYNLQVESVTSDIQYAEKGLAVYSKNAVCNKSIIETQNSPYWFSTDYNGIHISDYSHILIYVKLPDNGENYLFASFKDKAGNEYHCLAGDDYTLYPKGGNIPQKMTLAEGANRNWGVFTFPSGFEGFLEIPISNLYQRSSITATTVMYSFVYRFSHIGTDTENSPFVGQAFGVVQNRRNNTFGDTVTEICGYDSKYSADESATEMTADSALLYFDEVDGAENYLITAYKRVVGGYYATSEAVLYSNSGAVGGLENGEKYIISISARDSRDNIIAWIKPFEIEYCCDDSISNETAEGGIVYDDISSGGLSANKKFTTLNAASSELLNQNPNRGFRGCLEFYHFNITESEIKSKIDSQINKFAKNGLEMTTCVCYLYPGDYLEGSLGDEFYTTTQKIFDYLREKKVQILLRFAYYDVNNFNKRTPTTEEILRHISELSENGIIARNSDVLHAFQVGFVGHFGEWHSETDPKADRTAVITAFADKLLPSGVYSQVRMPAYKDFLADTNTKKSLIGFHLDSFFGIMDGTELGSSEYSYGLSQWQRQVTEGAYTPNDAELYYWGQFCNMGTYSEGYGSAIAASELRLTTFSGLNGYLDQSIYADSCMNYWKKLPVTEKWLKYNNLSVSAGWFKNNDGSTVGRNVYEYIRDYLGYRLSVDRISVSENSKGINVNAELVNYGFSAAFNLSSQIVLLDSNNNVVSTADFGNPEQWYGTNPNAAPDGTLIKHSVTATLQKPAKSGQYKIALLLKSKSGATARLDNNVPYENGYNILHKFNY